MDKGAKKNGPPAVRRYVVQCPRCRAEYVIESADLAKRGECAACGNVFELKPQIISKLAELKNNRIIRGDGLPPAKFGDVTVRIISLTEHREYPCGDCLYSRKSYDCSEKRKTSLVYRKSALTATELLLDVVNPSDRNFDFEYANVALVDADGVSVHHVEACFHYDELNPRFPAAETLTVKAHSRERCAVLFPEWKREICAVVFAHDGGSYPIVIRELPAKAKALLGSDLTRPHENPDEQYDACPYCGGEVAFSAIECPHCGNDVFRCPKCGARGGMEYHESATGVVKTLVGGTIGAIIGGFIGGTPGTAMGWIDGSRVKPSGYLECKYCGHVIK